MFESLKRIFVKPKPKPEPKELSEWEIGRWKGLIEAVQESNKRLLESGWPERMKKNKPSIMREGADKGSVEPKYSPHL